MAFDDLRGFIDALEKQGELKRVRIEVDPYLEITEFADRSVKTGGPALLFEKPKGSNIPVLINAFASTRRMEIALGVNSMQEIADRIVGFLELQKPESLLDKLKLLPKLAEIGGAFPKTVSTGPCKDKIRREGFRVDYFPLLHCWPGDAGRFITLPMVFSRDPETGKRNCGMYRMQVFDGQTTGMHWQKHKQGAEHYRRVVAEGKQTRMPVAVAIGADPVTTYSAILPLPPSIDEMLFAGFLRGKPVEMVKCETNDLEVPANSEIVLEGYCRSSAHGRFLHGQSHRTNLSTADAHAASRSARHLHARRRHLSQPGAGLDPQIVPGPSSQSNAFHLGHRAGNVQQMHHRGG